VVFATPHQKIGGVQFLVFNIQYSIFSDDRTVRSAYAFMLLYGIKGYWPVTHSIRKEDELFSNPVDQTFLLQRAQGIRIAAGQTFAQVAPSDGIEVFGGEQGSVLLIPVRRDFV
jgi:hypothetical protein